jgi:cytochrome c556
MKFKGKDGERSSGKKVGKIIGIVAIIVVVLALLGVAASYVFAHVAVQDFRAAASTQISEASKGAAKGNAVKLRNIPLGAVLNKEYRNTRDLETDYDKIYSDLAQYQTDKAKYETDVNAYNAKVKAGDPTAAVGDLSSRMTTLEKTESELNKRISELEKKLNDA